MDGFGAVTAAVGVISLVGAALLITVGRMQWPRLVVGLVITGVAGILNTTIGPTIRDGVNTADDHLGQFIGEWTGTTVTGLIGAIVLGTVAFWVWRNQIDLRTVGVAALVPPTITLIPGALGTAATTVVGVVPWALGAVLSFAFGIG